MPFGNPGGLGFVALLGEAPVGIDVARLGGKDGVDQARSIGEAVGRSEYFQAVTPVRRL